MTHGQGEISDYKGMGKKDGTQRSTTPYSYVTIWELHGLKLEGILCKTFY